MSKNVKNKLLFALLVSVGLCLAAAAVYQLPPVQQRLGWRLETLRLRVWRAWRPPEAQVFVPVGLLTAPAVYQATTPPTAQHQPTPAFPPLASPEPTRTAVTLTSSPPPQPLLPPQVSLSGVTHEYQQFNNCGPATLAMALSYWNWTGDQRDTRAALRPNYSEVDDKNVNPGEMAAYAADQPGLIALSRVAGDLELLKRLLAAGFPVVIEIGFQQHPRDWMGHYILLSGYDDAKEQFITQDSLIGADLPRSYAEIETGWQAFNRAYLVVSPQERQAEVLGILGDQADPQENLRTAVQAAQQHLQQLEVSPTADERQRFFAWYNLASSLTALGDYPAAAQAYDQAFKVYPLIPEDNRPWRMLWYQVGPLQAYFQVGRYQDVITLGNQALNSAGGPLLEEVFYWLGRAREAGGDLEKAIYDYKKAVEINPDSTPAKLELERLGLPVGI